MNDIKRCLKCEMDCLKSNFHQKNMSDDLYNQFRSCRKREYKENCVKNKEILFRKSKLYDKQYRDKINSHERRRRQSDNSYRLIKKTRYRIFLVLKSKTKSSSTLDISAIDIETYRKWIEFQFTPKMNWSIIEIDHVKPICMFHVSDYDQLKDAFNWNNTQPLLKQDHQQKATKFIFF